MKKLKSVIPLDDYTLACVFDDGMEKIADIKPFLQSEVFNSLLDLVKFKKVKNNLFFVTWLDEEADLSADTLWHIGVPVESETIL